jgi:hypothetical protein
MVGLGRVREAVRAACRHAVDLLWCRGNHTPHWRSGADRPECVWCWKQL